MTHPVPQSERRARVSPALAPSGPVDPPRRAALPDDEDPSPETAQGFRAVALVEQQPPLARPASRGVPRCGRKPQKARQFGIQALIFWAGCMGSPSAFASQTDAVESDPETRTSELVEERADAWGTPGFRLQLRWGYQLFYGKTAAPSGGAVVTALDPGYRLSEDWSLTLTLRYLIIAAGAWDGLRWSVTLGADYHIVAGLVAGLGLGYAGFMGEDNSGYDDAINYDRFGTASPGRREDEGALVRLSACDGDGIVGMLRLAYLIPVGDLFATGPVIEADVQATQCSAQEYVPGRWGDEEIIIRRWWLQGTVSASWSFAWR